MKSTWLMREGRASCILFLAGWGMDPEPFRSLPVHDHDLLMVYDYRQVEPASMIAAAGHYDSLHLVAWSMGVWIAGNFLAPFRDCFASTTAVNGTLTPIHEQRGIPPGAYDAIIRTFSPSVLEKFYRDMFDHRRQAERFLCYRPSRTSESILQELRTLRDMFRQLGQGDDIFDHKLIGSRDRIFPARSQLRSWGKENCCRIRAAHFPFYDWQSMDLVTGKGYLQVCD